MTTTTTPRQITIGGELSVNRLGYGAMKLTGEQVWGPYPDHDHAIRVLRGNRSEVLSAEFCTR